MRPSMAVIYLCPADKRLLCSWEGYASDIKQHFEKEHNGLLFYTNSVEIDPAVLHENRLLYYQDELYLIQSYLEDNDKLLLKLRFLGSDSKAGQIRYSVNITVKDVVYKYESERKISCLAPTTQGWEIDLNLLEKFHGKITSLTCTILFETKFDEKKHDQASRKSSVTSLRINNIFVEKNACDETEVNILDAINYVDRKLEKLKLDKEIDDLVEYRASNNKKKENDDIMDNISTLNLSILEEPFSGNNRKSEDQLMDFLPDIPEELNLSCSSCQLDMLPPIYLCANGHNVCSRCKSHPCKICNGAITLVRNTDLENISRTHKHLCRYSSDGCNEKLYYNEVRSHEAKCPFCKYRCASGCTYEGKFDHLVNHLNVLHSSIKINYTVRTEFPKNTEFYMVNRAIGIFYCKSEQKNEIVKWKATFCGPKERQFFCELTFRGSKFKDVIFMKRHNDTYEIEKSLTELKKMKTKDKYALLNITSYDN